MDVHITTGTTLLSLHRTTCYGRTNTILIIIHGAIRVELVDFGPVAFFSGPRDYERERARQQWLDHRVSCWRRLAGRERERTWIRTNLEWVPPPSTYIEILARRWRNHELTDRRTDGRTQWCRRRSSVRCLVLTSACFTTLWITVIIFLIFHILFLTFCCSFVYIL